MVKYKNNSMMFSLCLKVQLFINQNIFTNNYKGKQRQYAHPPTIRKGPYDKIVKGNLSLTLTVNRRRGLMININ